jgi:hypothetical protein
MWLRQLYFTYSNHWKILHAIWKGKLNLARQLQGKKGGRFICEDENPFTITISKTPFYRNLCNLLGSYTSILVEGNYFTGTRGSGTKYFAGDHIFKDQTLYIYAADNPNCFDERNLILQSILLII